MPLTDDYYKNPLRYDLDTLNKKTDLNFYIENIIKTGRNILDLGCGTGRIAIPVAEQGIEKGIKVTAIDNSIKMLDVARQKSKSKNLEFINADICNFNLGGKFNSIICAFNTLQHVYDITSMQNFMTNVKKHLAENGQFIFDVVNPDMNELSRDPDDYNIYATYKQADGKNVVVEDNVIYDAVKQVVTHRLIYNIDDKEPFEYIVVQRYFFPMELDAILNYNGFEFSKYGDFDYSIFKKNSPSQIYICKIKK